jgi:hypothetical protein
VTEQTVVIERHLCIERDEAVVWRDDQRIDLDHRGIEVTEGAVSPHDGGHRAAHLFQVQSQTECELTCLERLQSDGGLHYRLKDCVRGLPRDFLDLHASLSGGDHPDALRLAVQDDPQIELALETLGHLDIDTLNDLAFGAGLSRHQFSSQQGLRSFVHFVVSRAELDTARFSAGAGVNLRLDCPVPAPEFGRGIGCLLGTVGYGTTLDGYAIRCEQLLRLILMDVHVCSPVEPHSPGTRRARAPIPDWVLRHFQYCESHP